MIAPSFLLLDLGGTHLSSYLVYPDMTTKCSKIILGTQDPTKLILKTISRYRLEFPNIQATLGLPGPVDNDSKIVFCPPLSTDIDLRQFSDLNLHIVNDVISVIPLLYAHQFITGNDIVITVGTSLGAAYIPSYPPSISDVRRFTTWLSTVTSYEIAHLPSSHSLSTVEINPQPPTLAGLFSVSSLRYLLGLQPSLRLNSSNIPIVVNHLALNDSDVAASIDTIDRWMIGLVNTVTSVMHGLVASTDGSSTTIIHGGITSFLPDSYIDNFNKRIQSELQNTKAVLFHKQ